MVVVVVEPKGGINLGSIARLMENFGLKELRLVKPLLSAEEVAIAKKFAMRGAYLLDNAKRYSNLTDAIADVDLAIATSARGSYETLNLLRHAVSCERLAEILVGFDGTAAMVFGREDRGLSNEEIALCDLLVTIDTGTHYRTLNISHAAAILFYFATKSLRRSKDRVKSANRPLLDAMFGYFEEISRLVEPKDFRRERAALAFRRLTSRAVPTEKEASLIIGILRRTHEVLKGLNKRQRECRI